MSWNLHQHLGLNKFDLLLEAKLSTNLLLLIVLFVLHTNKELIGYSLRIESYNLQICSSLQTKFRWILGNQNPPPSSLGLFKNLTIFLNDSCFVFMLLLLIYKIARIVIWLTPVPAETPVCSEELMQANGLFCL
jgi:hypothetical protein